MLSIIHSPLPARLEPKMSKLVINQFGISLLRQFCGTALLELRRTTVKTLMLPNLGSLLETSLNKGFLNSLCTTLEVKESLLKKTSLMRTNCFQSFNSLLRERRHQLSSRLTTELEFIPKVLQICSSLASRTCLTQERS